VKGGGDKKRKPKREKSFPAALVFQRNDFTYVDGMVDPFRKERAGPKGRPQSAMSAALLLMYLKEIRSVLGLRRRVGGVEGEGTRPGLGRCRGNTTSRLSGRP
jgi:hypothetical protein